VRNPFPRARGSEHANPAPPRRALSVRRTTTHDCTRPVGLEGPVTILARGRDLLTTADRKPRVLGAACLDVRADFASAIIDRILADPPHSALAELGGAHAFHGFRAEAEKALPGERESGSLRYQLLDDVPITLMLSARVLRAAGLGIPISSPKQVPVDVCAGWVAGGTLLVGLTEQGPPFNRGPVAAPIDAPDDALAWHEFDPLPHHATRRHRRLDVWSLGETAEVDCFFRDSFAGADGVERVVHEYGVHATVDPETSRFVSCVATAGPLPYPECPNAVASAGRLAGISVDGLRRTVRDGFVGPTTCTHLNDTLRSLEDVAALLRMLRDEASWPTNSSSTA
jgi:Protein of unknown function (DUF2889)